MHQPWGAFREFEDWSLRWARLPAGMWGVTCFLTKTVTLSTTLNQAERRCTIAHETEHIRRGPVPVHLAQREEERADRDASRLLLPDVRRIGEVLAWARDLEEAADELWVDPETLRARLRHLHPSERGYLTRRLADGHSAA